MKMLLEVNVKVGNEDTLKPIIGNESFHEISNGNEVRVVNLATSTNLILRTTRSRIVIFINLLRHLLMERLTIKLTIF
jgi:hypothetical protein